jgi:hypothetical protein
MFLWFDRAETVKHQPAGDAVRVQELDVRDDLALPREVEGAAGPQELTSE